MNGLQVSASRLRKSRRTEVGQRINLTNPKGNLLRSGNRDVNIA